jgi:hypothetical protein
VKLLHKHVQCIVAVHICCCGYIPSIYHLLLIVGIEWLKNVLLLVYYLLFLMYYLLVDLIIMDES